MGPIPGGELEGEEKAWPADWSFSDDIENILLETNPDDPYSVTVWGVYVGSEIYITGATEESQWVKNLMTNPAARISVEGDLYRARAQQVASEDPRILEAYVKKYGIEPEEAEEFMEQGGILFRLSAR